MKATELPTEAGEALGPAVVSFLAERDLAPSSHRVYALALGRLSAELGPDTPLCRITSRRLTRFMTSSYTHLAPASWNRVTATLGSFFATPPARAGRRSRRRPVWSGAGSPSTATLTPGPRAIPADELLTFLGAEHPLRDKTLWWLLYEMAARASEVLALDVTDLDLGRRRAVVIGKGGRSELIGWETKTARLLPRLLGGRRQGPLFLADITPAPARQPALADLDPASGRARLSYRRAAELFTTASGGWTLHQLRHSRLTHLAEDGVQLPLLMTKSRHTSLTSLAIYAKPTFDAVAAATAALDPDRRPEPPAFTASHGMFRSPRWLIPWSVQWS